MTSILLMTSDQTFGCLVMFKHVYGSPIIAHAGSASPEHIAADALCQRPDCAAHATARSRGGWDRVSHRVGKRKGASLFPSSHHLPDIRNHLPYVQSILSMEIKNADNAHASGSANAYPADSLAVALTGVVDRYRKGEVDKFSAQSEIFQLITGDIVSDNAYDKSAAAGVYLEQIEEFDRIAVGAENRGRGTANPVSPRSASPAARTIGKRKKGTRARPEEPEDSDASDDDDNESRAGGSIKRPKNKQDSAKFVFA